ncbi:hypothetical protein ACLOJK_027964 [Asimina triloba]
MLNHNPPSFKEGNHIGKLATGIFRKGLAIGLKPLETIWTLTISIKSSPAEIYLLLFLAILNLEAKPAFVLLNTAFTVNRKAGMEGLDSIEVDLSPPKLSSCPSIGDLQKEIRNCPVSKTESLARTRSS